jgi:hypothetical protein
VIYYHLREEISHCHKFIIPKNENTALLKKNDLFCRVKIYIKNSYPSKIVFGGIFLCLGIEKLLCRPYIKPAGNRYNQTRKTLPM